MTNPPIHSTLTGSNPLRLQLGVIKAAVLIMGLGLGLATQPLQAAERSSPGEQQRVLRGEGRKDEAREQGGPRQLEQLHQQLGLNETQESLWQNAKDGTEKLRRDSQAERQARHDKMKQVLDSKSPDLRALSKDMDKEQEARQEKHKTVREAWLKFYDALNAEQKQKASHFLLGQIGMMGMHPMGHGAGEGQDDARPQRPQAMK